MKALADFISFGVLWHGAIPATPGTKEHILDAAEALSLRHVRVVFEHIARRYPTRSAQIERGLHLSRLDLGDRMYSLSTVADALNILQRSGLILRERGRGATKGTEREDRARTHINPALIALAQSWDAERSELYKRGLRRSAALPAKKTWAIHPDWNGPLGKPTNDATSSGVSVRVSDESASDIRTHPHNTPPPGKWGRPRSGPAVQPESMKTPSLMDPFLNGFEKTMSEIDEGVEHTAPAGARPAGGRRDDLERISA